MKYRKAVVNDHLSIHRLYKNVASIPGGLARLENEITEEYVGEFLKRSLDHGVCLVALSDDEQVIGEIHTYRIGVYCFSHVLSQLTIAVDPDYQGKGVGRSLFEKLISDVEDSMSDILRIELFARESNQKAIRFYETLGFIQEGRFASKIKNLDGSFESDIPMAWIRS